jgi:hypothetical protein
MFEVKTIQELNINEFNTKLQNVRNEGFMPLGGISTTVFGGCIYYTITTEREFQDEELPPINIKR